MKFFHDLLHPTTDRIVGVYQKMLDDLNYRVMLHSDASDLFQKAANDHQSEAERAAKLYDNFNKLLND